VKSWVVALSSLALIGLIATSPVAGFTSGWGLAPGEHTQERLEFKEATTLRVEVNVSSGSQVTMLLLDEVNFLLFEDNKTYRAVHESTTVNHLTVTVDVGSGVYYVVMFNQGFDDVQLHISITWESQSGGSVLYISPVLLIIVAIVVVAAVAAVIVLRRKKK
jgi:hypothetical protein